MAAVGKLVVRRVEFEVFAEVDARRDTGEFYALHDGTRVAAESVAQLREKLLKVTAAHKAKLSIPFTRNADGKIRHGAVVGVHGSNENLIVQWDDTKKREQIPKYGVTRSSFLRRLSDEETAELTALQAAHKRATDELNAFIHPRVVSLAEKTKQAIANGSSD